MIVGDWGSCVCVEVYFFFKGWGLGWEVEFCIGEVVVVFSFFISGSGGFNFRGFFEVTYKMCGYTCFFLVFIRFLKGFWFKRD